MNLKNTTILAAIAATVTTASASSIAVSFNRNADEVFLSTDTVGLVSQSNWNQTTPSSGKTGSLDDLVNNSGVATTVDLSWSSHGTWANGSLATPSSQLLKGYLDDNGPDGVHVDVTSIPYANYTVYVYFNNDFAGGTTSLFDIEANGTTYTTSGSFTQPQAGVFDSGNSIMITGLSGDLNLSSGERTNPGISNITGFQIVEVPEPSSAALLGLGGLALILRRRK